TLLISVEFKGDLLSPSVRAHQPWACVVALTGRMVNPNLQVRGTKKHLGTKPGANPLTIEVGACPSMPGHPSDLATVRTCSVTDPRRCVNHLTAMCLSTIVPDSEGAAN